MAKRFRTTYGWAGGYDRGERKYLGHVIRGNSHDGYWSYVLGSDIEAKTISEMKDKIHSMERGFPRRTKQYGKYRNPQIYLRTPGDKGWHYGDRVKIKPGKGTDEFANKTGMVIGAEGEYLRIRIDEPVQVKGVGWVQDDLWMPYTLRKIQSTSNPTKKSSLMSIVLFAGLGWILWKNRTKPVEMIK